MTAVGPEWRTKHATTVKKLVASLTKFDHQQIDNLFKLEKIDKNTIELNTKVDTMFKPMAETYEYQDILARLKKIWKRLMKRRLSIAAANASTICRCINMISKP